MKLPESTRDHPLGGQQVVQGDRQRPGVDRSAAARRRRRHVAPADLARRCGPRSSSVAVAHARSRRSRQRRATPRGRRDVADDAELDVAVRAEGVGGRRRPAPRSRPAPMSRPCRMVHMFSAHPQPTIRSAAADQLGGQGRGEAAGDVERPGVPVEQPMGDRRRGEQRAVPLGERLQLVRGPPRAPRPATNTGRRERSSGLRERGHGRRGPVGCAGGGCGEHAAPALRASPRPARRSGRLSRTVRRSVAGRRDSRGRLRRPRGRRDVTRTGHGADRAGQRRPGRRRSSSAARSPRRPGRAAGCGSWPPP